MFSIRNCVLNGCNGQLLTTQTGALHMDTRVTRLKCDKCGHICCSVQFIAPVEVMKFAPAISKNGEMRTTPRLRNPITVDLDPELAPEIKIHKDPSKPEYPIRDSLGRFKSAKAKAKQNGGAAV